ncbi:lipopolysaccharide transport periplasmic protein LptA [Fluviispira multicolorata]|uniref:Lipopolysaccharide transport periplasmic protein LptA n=1 Tax=Fluviispira multicolorata TaxID=2654512 RepID=A0A833N026_9BACT|nr:lipopolysaccharide transport periplasmic protein LptA [Fluviispira multicolorata]KAB8027763.1 lipopolysaccharide transport periplasmic protein LptA [Fluviispira multicolorata]
MLYFNLIRSTIVLTFLISFEIKADFKKNLPEDYEYQNNNESIKPKEKKKNEIEISKKSGSPKNDNDLKNDLANHNQNAPVYFEGNSAEGSRKTGVLNLIGNVVIIQDDLKLTANKAQIISSQGKTFGSGSTTVKKAIATGNVNIYKKGTSNTPEIRAVANEIEFQVPEKIMVLTGKAKVWRNKEFVNAEIITINLNTGDISLKDPHGTIDPKSTNSFSKDNKITEKKNNL